MARDPYFVRKPGWLGRTPTAGPLANMRVRLTRNTRASNQLVPTMVTSLRVDNKVKG